MKTPDNIPRIESIRLPDGWTARVLTGQASRSATLNGEHSDVALPDTTQWRGFLTGIVTAPTTLSDYTVLKYSGGGEVFRATMRDGPCSIAVIAKQSRLTGWRRRLSAALTGTRESRNFNRGLALCLAGVETALPLALLERHQPRREAWLITEFLEGLVDLDQVVLGLLANLAPERRVSVKRDIIGAVSRLLASLERNGLTHRDFKASNILLRHWDHERRALAACLVDLDGIHRTSWQTESRRWRPIIRLAASLSDYSALTRTDHARFLKAYLTDDGRGEVIWKSRFRRIAVESAKYVLRARGRKSQKLDGYTGEG